MKKKVSLLLCIFLSSCSSMNLSSSGENSPDASYQEQIIELKQMYTMADHRYVVYFYSDYCPACASLKDVLLSFLENKNRYPAGFYMVNLARTSEEDFLLLQSGNAMFDEEIMAKTLYATSLQETYFKSTPCLYFIEKIEMINTLTDVFLNYSEIYQFFTSDQ